MKAYQYENRLTGKRITWTETQIKDMNFDFEKWAYENDYELAKTIELGEDREEKDEENRPMEEIMIKMPRKPKAGDTITFYENIHGEIYASLQFSAIPDNGVINIIAETEEQDEKNN